MEQNSFVSVEDMLKIKQILQLKYPREINPFDTQLIKWENWKKSGYFIACIPHGICANSGAEAIVMEIAKYWPNYSGNPSFPIQSDEHTYPLLEYEQSHNKWDLKTTYGKLRYNLIEFIQASIDNYLSYKKP